MKNKTLAKDYIIRSGHRLAAVETLMNHESYADVIRESQELIELALKGLLRTCNVEVPHIHDVSAILKEMVHRLPKTVQTHVTQLAKISKTLRRDRELAFYGSEDLTPSEFYTQEDAKQALEDARWVYGICKTILK